ncbi:MAG: VOC family protein [Roseiflexaceae bacterium]
MATVRYLVHDLAAAIGFYRDLLGFSLVEQRGAAFAIVERGDLSLWLSGPQTSAAQPMPDGRVPVPGGWNRLVLEVDDLAGLVAKLDHASFRNAIIRGPGGQQIMLDDPSGNPIELFQPA